MWGGTRQHTEGNQKPCAWIRSSGGKEWSEKREESLREILRNSNFFFFFFLWPHLWLMEVLRLGMESELQLPAYATATAIPYPSCNCDIWCSLWQLLLLNPLKEARDRSHILTDTISDPSPTEP